MFRISCRCLLLVGVDLSKLCAKKCSNLFRRIHCRFPVELHTNPRIREMNQNLLQFSRDLILQESYEFRPRFSEDLPKFSSKFRNKLISQSFWVINHRGWCRSRQKRLPLLQVLQDVLVLQRPGGSVRGERANFARLILGGIEAKSCK